MKSDEEVVCPSIACLNEGKSNPENANIPEIRHVSNDGRENLIQYKLTSYNSHPSQYVLAMQR